MRERTIPPLNVGTGTWQPQRSILRQNVTSIQFVEDGEALIGGTSDGVLYATL